MAYTLRKEDGASYRIVLAASYRPLAADPNAYLEFLGDDNNPVAVAPTEGLIVAEKS